MCLNHVLIANPYEGDLKNQSHTKKLILMKLDVFTNPTNFKRHLLSRKWGIFPILGNDF